MSPSFPAGRRRIVTGAELGTQKLKSVPNGDPPWLEGVEGEQVVPLITEIVPVLRVPAGPGTGKTFGLRKRVLHILHPEGLRADPQRVLVCAFNRVIAADLRKEICEELARFDLEAPVVATIHGVAARIAGMRPRCLLPHEIDTMIYDVMERNPELSAEFENLHRKVLRALRTHEAGMESYPALAQEAGAWLADHGASMVGDLPRQVESRLRNGDYADTRFDHVIVDEFQDLTETEGRLAVQLLAPEGSLLVLGDRKQSIYAFRGNEDRGLDALPDLVDVEITNWTMDECRRCPGEIVALANAVMDSYHEPLVDVRGPGAELHQVHSESPSAEHRRLAREIVRGKRAKPDNTHLVLVTRRTWGYDLRDAIRLAAPDLTAQTVFSEDILETWPAREAFLLLSVVASPDDPATLRDWIAYKRPAVDGTTWKAPKRNAGAYALIRGDGLLSLQRVRALASGPVAALRGPGRGAVHERLGRLIDLLDAIPPNVSAREVVEHVLEPTRWVVAGSTRAELARFDVDRLRTEALSMLNEADEDLALDELVRVLRNRIASREPIGEADEPDIKIVTLWGAKGLTADFVYIAGLCDEALPGPFDPDSSGQTEGEHEREMLRLLYVSLTRAKRSLVISRALGISRGKVRALGLTSHAQGTAWNQTLHQCGYLADLPVGVLPNSVPGTTWAGIEAFAE